MTEAQKDRIRAAARELADALTDVGRYFEVSVEGWDVTTISEGRGGKYVYTVGVTATSLERIV